jgi:hypothetical protein
MPLNNVLLSMLANLCLTLVDSGRVASDTASEARELYLGWHELVLRYGVPPSTAAQDQQMEAQAKDFGIHMVELIQRHLGMS